MKRFSLVVVVAACGGGPDVATPRESPTLRLVGCGPALPAPFVDRRAAREGERDRMVSWSSGKNVRRAASVSFGMATTSGMIDAMVVRKTVQPKSADLARCYDYELRNNPGAGRQSLNWRFSVGQDGHVLFADPTSTSPLSGPTNACVSRILKSLTFPARTFGGSITITMPVVFDAITLGERAGPAAGAVTDAPWTPFAVRGMFAPEGAGTIARGAENVLRDRAVKLEACFPRGASGSLRTLFAVEGKGDVSAIRAGGIGNVAIEACVEKELAGVRLVNPAGRPAEIACDFARGDAQPWRVSPGAHYGLISASHKAVTFGDQTIAVGALEPQPLPGDKTYLIVADTDTPGSVLDNALAWAGDGEAAIVALRDGERAPRYLGMGRITANDSGLDAGFLTQPMILVGRGTVQACLGKKNRRGKLADAGSLAQQLATLCKTTRCASLVVGIEELAVVRDLVEVTGAARRAGFERVMIGGQIGCEGMEKESDEDGP